MDHILLKKMCLFLITFFLLLSCIPISFAPQSVQASQLLSDSQGEADFLWVEPFVWERPSFCYSSQEAGTPFWARILCVSLENPKEILYDSEIFVYPDCGTAFAPVVPGWWLAPCEKDNKPALLWDDTVFYYIKAAPAQVLPPRV